MKTVEVISLTREQLTEMLFEYGMDSCCNLGHPDRVIDEFMKEKRVKLENRKTNTKTLEKSCKKQ